MKLSFVIPAYNEADYIGTCLTSILRETKNAQHDIEIIVVNNASTDTTGKIAEGYPGVRVVYEPHKGIVRARQRGFLEATGDIIANIDADTELTPGWVEKVVEEFSRDKALVALSGPFIYHDLPFTIQVLAMGFYAAGFVTYIVNQYILRVGSMIQGGNFVVKKSALQEIGGFNVDIDFYGEDTDAARRLSKVGKVKFTFRLPIYASGRRLAAEGVWSTGMKYAINYLSTTFLKKPVTKTSTDVRPPKK